MAQTLTPLQVTACAGLLQNQGLAVARGYTIAATAYDVTPAIATLRQAMTLAAGAYPGLYTIGAGTIPALGDSAPSGSGAATSSSGFVAANTALAAKYMGNGDLSKFAQAEAICQGYADSINPFITASVNGQSYLSNTFTNTNNMVTGDITAATTNTAAWGKDLTNLGNLIDLNNLADLGSPLALIKQIVKVGGLTPSATLIFANNGVPANIVANFTDPTLSATDSEQKLIYAAMTKVTGSDLAEVLQILKVSTVNIDTMADLLNPYKIFPNSFQTLTVTNKAGATEKIYLNAQGTVNMAITNGLPVSVTSVLS